jgi:hypothetical protein
MHQKSALNQFETVWSFTMMRTASFIVLCGLVGAVAARTPIAKMWAELHEHCVVDGSCKCAAPDAVEDTVVGVSTRLL